jgi:V/A-type H+-transporting ATPase subunit K
MSFLQNILQEREKRIHRFHYGAVNYFLEEKMEKRIFKKKIAWSQIILALIIVMASLASVTSVFAQEEESAGTSQVKTSDPNSMPFALIAAAVAFGFGAIGAGIAIANIGAAAMGAIGERPEIAMQALLFIALADGIVVFGFITALMILGKV